MNNNRPATEVIQLRQSQLLMVCIGVTALVLGTSIYVFDRPATAVYFVPDSSTLALNTPAMFGMLGNYLPAFFHALAFALFASAIAGRRHVAWICACWFAAEVVFEVAQIDTIASFIAAATPAWFSGAPLLENIASHFLTGRFDTMDVLFLLLGCATAFAIGALALPHIKPCSDLPRIASRPVRMAVLLGVLFIGMTSIVSSGGTGDTQLATLAATAGHS